MISGKIAILFFIIMSVAINLAFLFSQSIRLDEAQTIWTAAKSIAVIPVISWQSGQLPVYLLLLHFWMQVFGSDIVIARLLSLVIFLISLPVIYRMIRESAPGSLAVLGTALYSLSPFVMWYSYDARAYTLVALLSGLLHTYFLRVLKSDGRQGVAGYAAVGIIGLFTSYFLAFVILTQVLYVFVRRFTRTSANPDPLGVSPVTLLTDKGGAFRALVPVYSVFIASYFPWLATVGYRHFMSVGLAPASGEGGASVFVAFIHFLFGYQSRKFTDIAVSFWPLSVLVIFFLFTTPIRIGLAGARYFASVTFIPILLIYAVSYLFPVRLSPSLFVATPTFFTLLAWTLINYTRRLVSLATVGVIAAMFAFLILQNRSEATPVKEDYQGVAEYLNENVTPYDIIAVHSPFSVYPVMYGYDGYARIDTIPYWDPFGREPVPELSPPAVRDTVERYKEIYSRMFVVYSFDRGEMAALKNYLDTGLELLDQKEYPGQIEVSVYRLRYDIPLPGSPQEADTVPVGLQFPFRQIVPDIRLKYN